MLMMMLMIPLPSYHWVDRRHGSRDHVYIYIYVFTIHLYHLYLHVVIFVVSLYITSSQTVQDPVWRASRRSPGPWPL